MVGKGPAGGSGGGQGLVREESSVGPETALVRVAGAASGDLVSEWEAEKTRVRFPSRQFLADVYVSMAPETGLVGAEREARAREQELSWRLRYARILRSPRSERWRGGAASDDGRLKSAQGVVGLLNLGNTCYVNSLLQCLLHTRELRALLCSGDVAADCREGALLPGALAALAHAAWTSKMVEEEPLIRLDPLPIYRVLKRRLGLPGDGEQHDAQELLLSLLDRLSEETNLRGGAAREEPELVWLLSLAEEWDIARETEARRNSSPIDGLFQSWELSQTTCGGCHGRSYSFASQRVLSVPLAAGASPSLQECLEAYFRGEELAEEVGWRCPQCRRVQRCGKRLFLLRPPPVLVLCLKRFTGPPRPRRLDTPVRVPAEMALGQGCLQKNEI